MAQPDVTATSKGNSKRSYWWILAKSKDSKAGDFTDPQKVRFEITFHNTKSPDKERRGFENLGYVQLGDRLIGYASTPSRIVGIYEVTSVVVGDKMKFEAIKLLLKSVEWDALKKMQSLTRAEWPNSREGFVHPLFQPHGDAIWRFVEKQPGSSRPADVGDLISTPSATEKEPIEDERTVEATPEMAIVATTPDALDDLDTHRSEYDVPERETEREDLRKSRIGQGKFRKDLIDHWQAICAVTGCSEQRILRASHIKPWRDSNNPDRLNKYNGLLLAPHLDALFDAGLISFDDSGRMLVGKLSTNDCHVLGINDGLRLRCVDEQHKPFLHIHRMMHGFNL